MPESPEASAGQDDAEDIPLSLAGRSQSAEPTDQDYENERLRKAIAERMEAEYVECLTWALKAFGPGWLPACRHFLLDKDEEDACRRSGARPRAAATVYTVKNGKGERRHFTVGEGGQVVEHASYQEAFGDRLLELHPTQTIEVRGEKVHPHRYSLCWAPVELYRPMTAESLAKLRATRERKRQEKLNREWEAANPLFASAGMKRPADGAP